MLNLDRLSREFARQAAISSPSRREGAMARYLAERFSALGGETEWDGTGAKIGGEAGNLIVRFAGTGRDTAPLLLSVHMDTVEPCANVQPQLQNGIFTSAGETILGSDDKSGIAEIIEALEILREEQIPHGPLEVVVTVCEEVGLLGAKQLDVGRLVSRRGIALDTSGIDKLILSAPAANKLHFTITGQEAHAGIAPEAGISAIAIAAQAISRMALGRIDFETTANIGTIRGGIATNIIPRRVEVKGEVRSHDPLKLEMQTRQMVTAVEEAVAAAACTIDGVLIRPEADCQVVAEYPRMAVSADSPLVQGAVAAAHRLGRQLELLPGGGGSDANIFNALGIETVILATGMTDVHTVNESVALADMGGVAELLVEIIRSA
ncbi:MAG: M20/M25/M40 family metallo-hydrolase [Desulfuromonadales bacterium]|nr:M20/M25/M40 family metallo-hydrolase [Desulfuromonadales bacterium]